VTHLSDKYESMRTSENGWTVYEAGMAQLDDIVGAVMQKVKDLGVDGNTVVGFTTDNGAENFTWPDGGQTPFAGGKGTVMEGGFRAPAMIRWPGKVPAGKVENGIISGLDWFPTFLAAAGNPNIVGAVMKYVKDAGIEGDTILGFTTDNGAENFTWPDGGQTPFAGGKGTALEGGFRVPMILRWPGKVPAGKVENGIMSGMDWFPTLVAAAGNANIAAELKQGKQLGDRTYKVHLDGYNQMDLITGKGPSARHEIFYFTEGTLSAVRIDDFKYRFTDQPGGWLGGTIKVDWPILTNLRSDPYERTGMPNGANGSLAYYNWFLYEFWRFQFVQKEVAKVAQTAIQFPPMQPGASFNLEAVKAQIEKARAAHGQ